MEKLPKLYDRVVIPGTVWAGRLLSIHDGLAVVQWDLGEKWGDELNPVKLSDLTARDGGWDYRPVGVVLPDDPNWSLRHGGLPIQILPGRVIPLRVDEDWTGWEPKNA